MDLNKVIIIIKDGRDYTISDTALIKDYLAQQYIPSIDKLLDWRLYLMDCKPKNNIEKDEIQLEIVATDYLLDLKQEKCIK